MNRNISFVLLVSAVVISASPGQHSGSKPPELPRVSALWNDLQAPLDTEPFHQKRTLREALHLLCSEVQRQHGRELPIRINHQAFKDENPDAGDLEEVEVQLKPYPRRQTAGQVLRGLLGHVQTGNATFVVKPGVVEITTHHQAHMSRLVAQTLDAKFIKQPLSFVLEELYEHTGVQVLLDPRVGLNARAPITITFTNEMSLATGLVFVAEMAGLKAIVTDNAIFVTTPGRARQILWEQNGNAGYLNPMWPSHSQRKEVVSVTAPTSAVAEASSPSELGTAAPSWRPVPHP